MLIYAPNIIAVLPNLLSSDNERFQQESNPISHPKYLNLSGSGFAYNLTATKKELPSAISSPTVYGHKFVLWQ